MDQIQKGIPFRAMLQTADSDNVSVAPDDPIDVEDIRVYVNGSLAEESGVTISVLDDIVGGHVITLPTSSIATNAYVRIMVPFEIDSQGYEARFEFLVASLADQQSVDTGNTNSSFAASRSAQILDSIQALVPIGFHIATVTSQTIFRVTIPGSLPVTPPDGSFVDSQLVLIGPNKQVGTATVTGFDADDTEFVLTIDEAIDQTVTTAWTAFVTTPSSGAEVEVEVDPTSIVSAMKADANLINSTNLNDTAITKLWTTGNRRITDGTGTVVPVEDIIRSGQTRRLTATGKDDQVFIETRES